MPKVSLIIPVYNVENYIEKCLDSVTNQTLKDIEIIIVNDCSQGNCEQIANKYKEIDKRVKYIKHEKNRGLFQARITGASIATGEYIAFLDSDDYVLEDTLQNMIKAIDHDVDMVYGMINHTWNNKANYLHKIENKEVDEEDQEEREQKRLNKLSDFISFSYLPDVA